MHYVITERNNRVILCYPEGDKEVYADYDAAMNRAVFISSLNPGVFQVQSLDRIDRRWRWMRAITDKAGKILHYKGDAFGPLGE